MHKWGSTPTPERLPVQVNRRKSVAKRLCHTVYTVRLHTIPPTMHRGSLHLAEELKTSQYNVNIACTSL